MSLRIRSPQLREYLEEKLGQFSYNSDTGTFTVEGNLVVDGTVSYSGGEIPLATTYLGALTVGKDDTGYDVKFYGATSGNYWLWDESADKMVVIGEVEVGADTDGYDVKFFGDTTGKYWLWDESADKMVIAGDVDITGDTQLTGDVVIGVNGTGHDVTIYTDSSGSKIEVDESADALNITAIDVTITGDLTVGVDATGHDVIFYGDTSTYQWKWDQDGDTHGGVVLKGTMTQTGNFTLTGGLTQTGNLSITGNVTGITGTVVLSNATDATNSTSGAIKTAGGLGVAKKAFVGTDLAAGQDVTVGRNLIMTDGVINMSAADTGNYEIVLKASQADALSIKHGSTDMVVFDTDTGAIDLTGAIGITGDTDITGDLTLIGDLDWSGDSAPDLILDADESAALSITDGSDDILVIDTSTAAFAITALAAITVGVDETGHDVKLFGDTTGAYMLWDESEDRLKLVKAGLDIGVVATSIEFATPTNAFFLMPDDQTFASDSNEAILADISGTTNAGFIKVVIGASDRYIALYELKAS